ncbi:MAG: DUF2070 family protein [Thermoplasmata archaeon]|nr:MAG: DUF2070 family protein [Thermoplasmata archaeon]
MNDNAHGTTTKPTNHYPEGIEGQSLEELEEIRVRKATGVAEKLIKAPSPSIAFIFIVIISLSLGYIAFFDLNAIPANFTWDKIYSSAIIFGIAVIGVPALIAVLTITPTAKALGGVFLLRRAALLAFVSVLIIGVFIIIAKFVSYYITIDFILTLGMAYACILAFQLSVLAAVSNDNYLRSLPPALIQPGLGLLILFFSHELIIAGYAFTNTKILIILLQIVIFVVLSIMWITIVATPLKRVYGVNGLKLVRQSFEHQTGGESEGTELESFFESFGKTVDASAGVLAVRRPTGAGEGDGGARTAWGKQKKFKALMVVPDIHKGPFGHLGGSNMPEKLAREFKGDAEHVITPHGTATHDMNPVSSAENRRLIRALKSTVDELPPEQFSSSCSKMIRKRGTRNVNVTLQYLGESPVSTYTAAPRPTDDINYKIGPQLRSAMATVSNKVAGKAGDPVFIDAHNSMAPGEGYVHYGSKKSKAIMDTLKDATSNTVKEKQKTGLKIGLAQKGGYSVDKDGLGPLGIQALAVETPPKHRVVYIVFDGNNLKPGLRDEIVKLVLAKTGVEDAEAITTDNHIVNQIIGGYEPVGEKIDRSRLLKDVVSVVKRALKDLEPVEVASTRVKISNFKVFGKGNTLKLSTTINDTVKLMGIWFVICYGAALGLSLGILGYLL